MVTTKLWYIQVILLWLLHPNKGFIVPITVDIKSKVAAIVDERFLSVTIDSSFIKFKNINFKLPRFLTLAQGLNKLQSKENIYLRIGGSDADHIEFDPTIYIFNRTEFESLYQFASSLNWRLIFDLNCLERKPDASWDPSNAVELISFARERNYSIDYELGNEPDLFPTHLNITIPPEQLAKDYKVLRRVLDVVTLSDSKLIGPDIATLTRYNYFYKFLSHVEEGVLDAVSFHQYYSASTNVTSLNFTFVEYLDRFLTYGLNALSIIKQSFVKFPHPPIWIGETSSTYGGGNPNIGESFVAGFLWLDKLGLSAQMNLQVIARQALKGGFYSLIDSDYNPCPDYWITMLYKQLVGTQVLHLTGYLKFNKTVRVYAHCVNKYNQRNYDQNSFVLIALNLNSSDSAEIHLTADSTHLTADQFIFSPANGHLNDRLVSMNGQILKMINDTTLPDLLPIATEQPFVLPPLTYGFFVIKGIKTPVCRL